MPRFYLHLHECGDVTFDKEGLELPNIEAARRSAVTGARSIMAEEVRHGRLCMSCHIEIANAAGDVITSVAFKDAVSISDA